MITLFIIIIAITCVYTAGLIYYSNALFTLKLIALPLQLAFFIFISYQLILLAGAPINSQPKGKFNYVHHEITDQGSTIILWMYTPQKGHRLYKMPYDREQAKKLADAQDSKNSGKNMEGEFQPNAQDNNRHTTLFISEQSLLEYQDIMKNVDNQ